MKILQIVSMVVLGSAVCVSAQAPAGLFSGSDDIGKTKKGESVYDGASKTYRVTGGGADVWFAEDDFHFVWVKLSGNAALTADVAFTPQPAQPLAKAMLMVRQSLDPGSAYADEAIHADGHVTLQWRETAGGRTSDLTAAQHNSKTLRIERKGDSFTAYVQKPDGSMEAFGTQILPMTGDVYVGLGVCSHDADGLATVTFSNVKVEQPQH